MSLEAPFVVFVALQLRNDGHAHPGTLFASRSLHRQSSLPFCGLFFRGSPCSRICVNNLAQIDARSTPATAGFPRSYYLASRPTVSLLRDGEQLLPVRTAPESRVTVCGCAHRRPGRTRG
jgi:hypothetical protein